MKNLEQALRAQAEEELITKTNEIKSASESEDPAKVELLEWYMRIYSPKSRIRWEKMSKPERVSYVIEKIRKEAVKQLSKDLQIIEAAKQAEEVEKIIIKVEWKRSQMWGSNPSASVEVRTKTHRFFRYNSGSIGGCGYDKESAAISEALNQSNEVLKMLFEAKDKDVKNSNENIFSYGMNSGILPTFSSGCGVSCYYNNFEAIGMKFEKITGGNSFDVYQAIKL